MLIKWLSVEASSVGCSRKSQDTCTIRSRQSKPHMTIRIPFRDPYFDIHSPREEEVIVARQTERGEVHRNQKASITHIKVGKKREWIIML